MGVSDPTSEAHLWNHKIILLRPWIPLETVSLGLCNPPLQKLTHIPPVLTLNKVFFLRLRATDQGSHLY